MKPGMRTILVLSLVLLLVLNVTVSGQGSLLTNDAITGIQIQNISESDASAVVEFYDAAGTLHHSLERSIPQGASTNVYMGTISQLAGGRYSAVILSNAELVSVANTVNRALRVGDSYLNPREASEVFAPLVFRSHNMWTSVLYVQNAMPTSIAVRFDLYRVGQTTPSVTKQYTIPAFASQEVDLGTPDFDAFGVGFGSAIISTVNSTDRIAVVVTNDRRSSTTSAMVHTQYRGLDALAAGRTLYAPLTFKRYNEWDTGVSIQNTAPVSTTVTITYTASPRSPVAGTTLTVSMEVGPYAAANSYLPALALPNRFYGSAVISSSASDILVIVNNVRYSPEAVGSSYEAFSVAQATSAVAAPLIFRGWADSETGINAQNLGTEATNITVRIVKDTTSEPSGGSGPWEFTITNVAPGGAATFYLPELMPSVTRLYGSATITSSNEVPIAVVINSPAYPRGLSANYAGINY